METWDEASLVKAVRGDDSKAFLMLYQHYAPKIFNFLWNRTPDRETAEDLVQETFAKLWQMRADLDVQRNFRSLLFRIARNLAIDHLRQLRRQGLVGELDEGQPAPPEDPEAFVKRDRVRQALRALSQHQRAVFCLSRFEGLKYVEIATILGISIKTVEVHMGRALKKLRDRLWDLNQFIFFTPLM